MRTLSAAQYRKESHGFTTDCWIWLRYISHTGHGRAWCSKRQKVIGAHVLIYERHGGRVPNGKELHHLCKVRSCVNPAHLAEVTRKEHMSVEGRQPFGNRCAWDGAKRVTHDGRTLTLKEWSDELGLSEDTVYRRIHNYGWPEEIAVSTPMVRYRRNGVPK